MFLFHKGIPHWLCLTLSSSLITLVFMFWSLVYIICNFFIYYFRGWCLKFASDLFIIYCLAMKSILSPVILNLKNSMTSRIKLSYCTLSIILIHIPTDTSLDSTTHSLIWQYLSRSCIRVISPQNRESSTYQFMPTF